MNDNDDLDRTLKTWKLDLPDDPHFSHSVWWEIEKREQTSFRQVLSDLCSLVARPGVAIPVGVAAIAITVAFAALHGHEFRTDTWDRLALSYRTTIDPIAHIEIAGTEVEE